MSQKWMFSGQQMLNKMDFNSGPQGSVLFLAFINDLPEEVDCQVALFADYTLIYQTIKCSYDTLKFQENLTALSKWADRWGMDFKVKKSKIILLFNSRSKFPHYSLHGHELEILGEVKYLGVTIQSDMTFTAYIQRKLMTANRQLGVIRRALYWAPTNAKLLAYNTLCLPHLEYAATAWDPSNKKDISDTEQL